MITITRFIRQILRDAVVSVIYGTIICTMKINGWIGKSQHTITANLFWTCVLEIGTIIEILRLFVWTLSKISKRRDVE